MENELTRWKGQSFFTPRRLPSSLCHFTSLSLVSEGNTDRSLLHSLTLFPYCPCTPPRSRRRLVSFVKLWTRSAPQLLQSFSQLDWFLPVFVTPFVLVPIHFKLLKLHFQVRNCAAWLRCFTSHLRRTFSGSPHWSCCFPHYSDNSTCVSLLQRQAEFKTLQKV